MPLWFSHMWEREPLFLLLSCPYVGIMLILRYDWVPLSFLHRWLKGIGSGAASPSKWTVPFSQASMGCGTCMSLRWCSCMHLPIRTMGMTSPMVSYHLFSTIYYKRGKLPSPQDVGVFPSNCPVLVSFHVISSYWETTKRSSEATGHVRFLSLTSWILIWRWEFRSSVSAAQLVPGNYATFLLPVWEVWCCELNRA